MKKKLLLLTSLISSIIVFSQQNKVWVPYRDGDRWGYSDTLAKVIVKPVYDSAGFIEGSYGFVYTGNKAGVISNTGIELIKPAYTLIEDFEGGFKVYQGNKAGYASAKGKLLLPALYDDIYSDDGEFLILQNGKKYGLASKTGIIILPVEYDEITSEFLSSNVDAEKYFLVRKDGAPSIFHKQTHKLQKFNEGTVEEKKEGIMDALSDLPPSQEELLSGTLEKQVKEKLKADEVVYFPVQNVYASQVYFLVTIKGKKGVVEYISATETKTLVPIEYDAVSYVLTNSFGGFMAAAAKSEYLAAVSKNGKYGIVNESGETIVSFEYSSIGALNGYTIGFELTKDNKKGVFLPTTTYPVIQPGYDSIEYSTAIPVNATWSFVLYSVTIGGKYGYVGENGKEYFK